MGGSSGADLRSGDSVIDDATAVNRQTRSVHCPVFCTCRPNAFPLTPCYAASCLPCACSSHFQGNVGRGRKGPEARPALKEMRRSRWEPGQAGQTGLRQSSEIAIRRRRGKRREQQARGAAAEGIAGEEKRAVGEGRRGATGAAGGGEQQAGAGEVQGEQQVRGGNGQGEQQQPLAQACADAVLHAPCASCRVLKLNRALLASPLCADTAPSSGSSGSGGSGSYEGMVGISDSNAAALTSR